MSFETNFDGRNVDDQVDDGIDIISMPRPLAAAMSTTSRYSLMSGGDFLPAYLLSRSCSAPPVSDTLPAEPVMTSSKLVGGPLLDALKMLDDLDLDESSAEDEGIQNDDFLLDPNYATFFYNQARIDPRLPPPIYRPGQSWQQQNQVWTSIAGLGNTAPGRRSQSRFVPNVTEATVDDGKQRKKLVEMIQEDFPRTPSPVYAARLEAATESKPTSIKTDPLNTQSLPPEWIAYHYNNVRQASVGEQQLSQFKRFSTTAPDYQPTYSFSNPGFDYQSHAEYLLEELRRRKVELSEVAGVILEFSMDQHGSRYIQQKLETAGDAEKTMIFQELSLHALDLMTDVFGNYVIQKFFEFGNEYQRVALAESMRGHVVILALQMYGCRVVQKALEHVPKREQKFLVAELDGHILRCVRDQNGNHVIQKCIECIDPSTMPFLVDAFKGQVYSLATHPYGCRVIQRIFEHGKSEVLSVLLSELHQYTVALVQDQYGNYVVQHILEQGTTADRQTIINKILSHFIEFSCHKFASNVVEKCVAFGSEQDRQSMITTIMKPMKTAEGADDIGLLIMMRDQFANYVIQKMLDVVQGTQRDQLLNQIRPHVLSLKKYTFGKHILAKLDRPASSLSTSPAKSRRGHSGTSPSPPATRLAVDDPIQFPPLGH